MTHLHPWACHNSKAFYLLFPVCTYPFDLTLNYKFKFIQFFLNGISFSQGERDFWFFGNILKISAEIENMDEQDRNERLKLRNLCKL
jgi:hypothetical protein